jgi:hypothetical protein
LAVITLLDLVLLGRTDIQPKPSDWAPGTERFTAVDWLFAKHPEDRWIPMYDAPFRLLNTGMTYDQPSASGYGSVLVWYYVNLLWTLDHGAPYGKRLMEDDLAASRIRNLESPLVDLLNIRWAIGPNSPGPRWIERFRPTPGAPPHARHEPMWDPLLRVYENPRALPRAFVVYSAQVLPDDEAQARALTTLDPRTTAILDREPAFAVGPAPGGPSPFTPARIVQADSLNLTIEAEAPAPGVLVVSEAAYPGWSATLDGRPVPLLRADYAFRGVALPAGRHVVKMTFQSRPTRLGLFLSAIGCLGLLALGLFRLPRK